MALKLNIQGLRTVGYKVDNLAQAKEWYSNILGIEPYFDEPFYVGFNVRGYELGLQPADEVSGEPQSTGLVVYWGVPDVKSAYQQLLDEGATSLEEPADVGGGIVVAAVLDPWGNAFGVIYNPHFKLP